MRISDWSSDVCSSDLNASTTSRGIQRPDAQALIDAGVQDVPVPAQRWGNPESEAARIFVNAGIELSDEMEFYTFGNYSWSRGTTAFFYRNPNASFISTSIPLTNTPGGQRFSRSEEHTSELQSLMRISYAVFCLKKKKKTQ